MWHYQSGDRYDLYQLEGFKRYFEENLQNKIKELERMERWRKYGLPNWRSNYIRAQMGVEEARENLQIVEFAIAENKERNKNE